MFPDSPDLVIPPLTYQIFIREVLIPEAVARIIQADLELQLPEDAVSIIEDSHQFGLTLHPVDDDCPHLMHALQVITERNQRIQSMVRSWEASRTDLPLEEWTESQKKLAIKVESMEVNLSSNGEVKAPGLAGNTRGDPIDLTEM